MNRTRRRTIAKLSQLFAVIVIPLVIASAGAAQDAATGGGGVRLLDVKSWERTAGGKLDACEITFGVGFEDFIYRNGALVVLKGAVSFMANPGDKIPAIVLKVSAFDYENDKLRSTPISYAYLSVAGNSYAGKEVTKFTCEDGGLCLGYDAMKYLELGQAIGNEFEINFNRRPGGSDVRVPLSILRERPKESMAYSQCVLKLLDVIMEKLAK